MPLLVIALAMMAAGCGETGQGSAIQTTTGTGGKGSMAVKNGSSSYQIVELYIAPSTSASWGENLLVSAISAGSTRTISDLPADTYDLLAVFSNSGEYELYEFIVASGQTYQVTATPSSTQVIADPLLLQTELLSGTWHFIYTIGGTTFTNDYTLDDIDGSKNDQGGYYIYGTGQSGDLVNASYFPTDGNWALLDPGTTIDRFYTFYTDGSTILANSCYFHEVKSTGIWTSCYALTGSKTAGLTAPEAFPSIMFGHDEGFRALSATDAIEVEESVKKQYNALKLLSK